MCGAEPVAVLQGRTGRRKWVNGCRLTVWDVFWCLVLVWAAQQPVWMGSNSQSSSASEGWAGPTGPILTADNWHQNTQLNGSQIGGCRMLSPSCASLSKTSVIQCWWWYQVYKTMESLQQRPSLNSSLDQCFPPTPKHFILYLILKYFIFYVIHGF